MITSRSKVTGLNTGTYQACRYFLACYEKVEIRKMSIAKPNGSAIRKGCDGLVKNIHHRF
jgi:type IV pilus biogenesis protein CpaD/CtpE